MIYTTAALLELDLGGISEVFVRTVGCSEETANEVSYDFRRGYLAGLAGSKWVVHRASPLAGFARTFVEQTGDEMPFEYGNEAADDCPSAYARPRELREILLKP